MGEIADAMINGELDSITGEYIGRPVGYPRTLENKNLNPTIGINIFLKKHGINKNDNSKIVTLYTETILNVGKNRNYTYRCMKIQENFNAFKQWFIKYNSKHE